MMNRVPLGDLCIPIRGVTFSAGQSSVSRREGYIACLTTSSVQDSVEWESRRFVPNHVIASEEQFLRNGDILVSTANSKALVGKSCLVREVPEPCTFGAFVTVFRPKPNVSPIWLAYLLRSPQLLSKFAGFSSNTTNISNLNVTSALRISVAAPDEAGQVKTGALLDEKTAIAHLVLGKSITQFEDAQRLFSATLCDAFPSVIPISVMPKVKALADWGWEKLLDIADLESGHTPSRRHPEWWGGKVPWLSLTDIRNLDGKHTYETGEYTNDAGLANSSARLLPSGTVCLSRTASIGFVTILGKPMATSQDFVNWICDEEKLDPEFLMYAFMASRKYLQELGSGAVHKTIYMPTVESFHVCAPDITEQRRIARTLRERLAAAELLTASLKTRLAEIDQLPQRLLAAAFGEVL